MFSRFLEVCVCCVLAATAAGCSREERRFSENPAPSSANASPYEHNAYGINQGKQLYEWFNCNGCHAQGGGAIGPPLMDERWIYGGAPGNIYSTIVEGRPNGMPSFGGKIPPQQVWQIVAYVQSMSGQVRKDAAPSRSDHLFMKKSEQSTAAVGPQQP
jgi:cytochrome c oxidase cbb3-type subunit 3